MTILPILVGSCNYSSTQIAREAADRQAQQNTVMAELNEEVASGTRRLVDADAQARQEIVSVHRDFQAERRQLDTNWNALEEERRQMADRRQTESLLVPVAYYAGLVAVLTALLGFCWYVVVAANRSDHTDQELNAVLIETILADQEELLANDATKRTLLGSSSSTGSPVT
jgi:hypothetical protein